MSEKETLGMTEQVKETKELSAAEKAKKKKAKYTLAKVVVIFCAVLCVVLTVFEMGFTYRAMKAVEVDGTEYSVAEYNWLYTNSVYEVYSSFYQTYGDLASYFFNPQNPLDEQQYTDDQTWADYIREYTDNAVIEMTALYDAGKEAGFVMDDEHYAVIDTEWDTLETTASLYGYGVNEYVELNYGRGVNEEVFRSMYERYLYAISYAQYYVESQEVSADEIDAYYGEHSEDFDMVSFRYYFADGSADEGEAEEIAMEKAKTTAEAVLNGEEEVEFTEYSSTKGNLDELYADWLFDDARVSGDKEIFEDETGYYVMEFVENVDLHYNTVDVRHILVEATGTDEEALAAALEQAEEYKAEWESLGKTEDNFAELAVKYSADTGSAADGGLYENVYKGQMVEEFEDWCFDSARKAGDCEIIETTYGYHIMYFVGEAEEYYTYTVENAIVSERYTEHLDSLIEGDEITELFGSRFVAKHLN